MYEMSKDINNSVDSHTFHIILHATFKM